jgi:hypothetical protein
VGNNSTYKEKQDKNTEFSLEKVKENMRLLSLNGTITLR